MPTKAAYLRFLDRYRLSEADVPPILPKSLVPSAQRLVDQAWPNETREEMVNGLASNTNTLIESIVGSLEARLEMLGAPKTPLPFYAGVFPSKSFNAQAVLIEDGALLLIDTGCFSLLEALIMFWGCSEDPHEGIRRAAKIVVDYVDSYQLPKPEEYDLPEMHRDGHRLLAFVSIVTKSEEFVLGHELGHLRLGHLLGQQAPRSGGIYPANRSWDDEISADLFALDLLTHKRDALDIRTGCAGAYVFFATAGLIERALQRGAAPRVGWTDTHPPSVMRAAVLEQALVEHQLLDSADLGQRFNWWANEVGTLIEQTPA